MQLKFFSHKKSCALSITRLGQKLNRIFYGHDTAGLFENVHPYTVSKLLFQLWIMQFTGNHFYIDHFAAFINRNLKYDFAS
jgi:hypothetical protein